MCVFILVKEMKVFNLQYWALNIKFCVWEKIWMRNVIKKERKKNRSAKLDIHKDLWENGYFCIFFLYFGKCVKRNLFSTWNVLIFSCEQIIFYYFKISIERLNTPQRLARRSVFMKKIIGKCHFVLLIARLFSLTLIQW